MRRPKVDHKPPAPSVREIVGAAFERSRALTGERPMTREEVVEDIIAKLDLPKTVQDRLRQRSREN